MKKSILILSISIFSLTLFAQTPQKADVITKTERADKVEKSPMHQTEEMKLRDKELGKEIGACQDKIIGFEKEYELKPSSALLKKLNKEKLNMKILRNKGRTEHMEMKYKSNPSEGLLKEINEEKSTDQHRRPKCCL